MHIFSIVVIHSISGWISVTRSQDKKHIAEDWNIHLPMNEKPEKANHFFGKWFAHSPAKTIATKQTQPWTRWKKSNKTMANFQSIENKRKIYFISLCLFYIFSFCLPCFVKVSSISSNSSGGIVDIGSGGATVTVAGILCRQNDFMYLCTLAYSLLCLCKRPILNAMCHESYSILCQLFRPNTEILNFLFRFFSLPIYYGWKFRA